MKRYAELIGNYKKLEIKSFNDNILDAPDSLAGLLTNVLGRHAKGSVKVMDIGTIGY